MNQDLGNTCSAIAFQTARRTFRLRHGKWGEAVEGPRGFYAQLIRYGEALLAVTSDGIGTKTEVAERLGRYDTLGFDLVAMVADDLAAVGAEPANLSDILDVDRLDEAIVRSLMKGLEAAANLTGMSIIGGETAELGDRIHGWGEGMHFNWCATALGFIPPGSAPLDGQGVEVGHAVIALRNPGVRSNGFSLARRILSDRLGDHWHTAPCDRSQMWGEALLTPSPIYSPLVCRLREEGIPLSGVAHITGGGIPDNFVRILRARRHGARLKDLFPPDPFLCELQRMGGIGEAKAYRAWNMGNGMLLVVPSAAIDRVLERAASLGYQAKRCGEVTADPLLVIDSLGDQPQTLSFSLEGGK